MAGASGDHAATSDRDLARAASVRDVLARAVRASAVLARAALAGAAR